MSTVACGVPTLVPATPALPALPPMPRMAPSVAVDALRPSSKSAIRLRRPAWSRSWLAIAEAWGAWRARARLRAQVRALAALDAHVLRDVGLGDLAAPPYWPSWLDIERARW